MSAHKAGCKVYLESVGKESEFICDICCEHFGNKGALNAHKRKHDGTIVTYKRVKVQCEICGQFLAKCNMQKHLRRHQNNPKSFKIRETYKLDHDNLFCKFCGKECKNKNSLIQHKIRCKQNPNRVENYSSPKINRKGQVPWNKGLTKETDQRIAKGVEQLRLYYTTHDGTYKGRTHTEDYKKYMSTVMTQLNHGHKGRRTHGKGGYIDGLYLMSTYELVYYVYMRDHNYNIHLCENRFQYEWQGKIHFYTPDFVVDGKIVEIKGYESERDTVKYKAVENITVLYYEDIKHCFDYVTTVYNVKDVTQLYQKNS